MLFRSIGHGFRSVNVALRKELDLYCCLRPTKYYEGIPDTVEGVDIVICRENHEDLYAGIEFEEGTEDAKKVIEFLNAIQPKQIRSDSGVSIKPISIFGSRRIVSYAFEYARKYKRKKVTAVHKSNIMKFSDGLFLHVARDIAKEYPDIEFEDRIVDNLSMQLVRRAHEYDVRSEERRVGKECRL